MSSAMKGEPGLASGLTTLGALHPFIHACMIVWSPKRVSSEDRTGARAPSASYCSTQGVAPLHTTSPVPEITPLLHTGIGERYSQTISNLGHAALLLRYEPPINESAELTQGAL
jgi:hypothetical protein